MKNENDDNEKKGMLVDLKLKAQSAVKKYWKGVTSAVLAGVIAITGYGIGKNSNNNNKVPDDSPSHSIGIEDNTFDANPTPSFVFEEEPTFMPSQEPIFTEVIDTLDPDASPSVADPFGVNNNSVVTPSVRPSLNPDVIPTATKTPEGTIHVHNYVFSYDDFYEYFECAECGDVQTRNHSLDNGILNSDGSTTYKCTNKGCGYTLTLEKKVPATPSPSPSMTAEPTASPSPSPSSFVTPSPSVSPSVSPTPTSSVTPSPSPSPSIGLPTNPVHAHVWGNVSTNVVKNGDGTHSIKKIQSCLTCGETREISNKINKCEYKLIDKNNKEEVYECTVCGDVKVINVAHSHDLSTKTTYEKSTDGKKHVKVEVTTCSSCDYETTKKTTENCNHTKVTYGKYVHDSKTDTHSRTKTEECVCGHAITLTADKGNCNYQNGECTVCHGKKMEEAHKHDLSTKTTYEKSIDGKKHVKVETTSCASCDYSVVNRVVENCNHVKVSYGEYVHDEKTDTHSRTKTEECSCGHAITSIVNKGNCNYQNGECTVCHGKKKEEAHKHDLSTKTTYEMSKDGKQHVKVEVTSCSSCDYETTKRTTENCKLDVTYSDYTHNEKDDTHSRTKTEECICGYEKVNTLTNKCNYVNDECTVCHGKKKEEVHKHDLSTKTTYEKSTNGTTHTKVETTTCAAGDYNDVKKTTENCNHSNVSFSYKKNTYSNNHTTTKTETCVCGHVITSTQTESCNYENGKCKECGGSRYNPPVHTHDYTTVVNTTYKKSSDGKTHTVVTTKKCSCGATHDYETTENCSISTNINCTSNNDNTHSGTKTESCKCGYSKNTTITGENCTFDASNECAVCHGKKKEEHVHSYENPTYSDYSYDSNNEHTRVKTETCSCGDKKITTERSECNYSYQDSGYVTSDNFGVSHIKKQVGTCSKCGHVSDEVKEVRENCSFGAGTPDGYIAMPDGEHRLSTVSYCVCGYKKTALGRIVDCDYSHSSSESYESTDSGHTKVVIDTCVCGNTKETRTSDEHTWNSMVYNPVTNAFDYTCGVCGRVVSVPNVANPLLDPAQGESQGEEPLTLRRKRK